MGRHGKLYYQAVATTYLIVLMCIVFQSVSGPWAVHACLSRRQQSMIDCPNRQMVNAKFCPLWSAPTAPPMLVGTNEIVRY
jgi:hypothetical protein